MSLHCSLTNPLADDNFVPCFREIVLDGLFSLLLLLWALYGISAAWWKYRKTVSALYAPLKSTLPRFSYGATPENANDDSESTSTTTPGVQGKSLRWSIYSWVRLLAVVQSFIFISAFYKLSNGQYTIDPVVEGVKTHLLFAYGVFSIFWMCVSIIAVINILVSAESNPFSITMGCYLNVLYFGAFVIGMVDLRSHYIVHDTDAKSDGYTVTLYTSLVNLILLLFIINEEPSAPSENITTEDGRELSGEEWASIYSVSMFSWVGAMMKKGHQRTLDDVDLSELPENNRARNTLSDYKKKKTLNMSLSIFKTFQWPLFQQFMYCMVWCVVVFGPPYYLNKIIKYIENSDPFYQVSLFTAFLYVFGLFITSTFQSLILQQALYIGRTLGIRLQSIVIGEVFNKSLRRRDLTGSQENPEDKEKGNVNNLLSVDAQKIGELTAYLFYVYSFPIQIIISVWALYKLLGHASLWGVLIILVSQPMTYFISNRFDKLHGVVMSATDKRLRLMNELLTAIRIVKFFAWEKEFESRVVNAREDELKAVRNRLLTFMWMTSVWFMIPIMIMVTVFYFYTLTEPLTASVAFTALALFNTFRNALDEFPMIISFILQANVSIRRIERFLEEEEVEQSPSESVGDVYIGFTNNASFGWQKAASAPSLRNLNLSFPRGKLSVICGPTGSGKTTLLSSLLGETYCLTGNVVLPRKSVSSLSGSLGGAVSGIAYVAQTAWLQNCSIRDNILFGLPYDEKRYETVLYMTALTRDLDILEFGDSTEVGEKGITLSGGQKQRVAIARAVYSQADIVILDDCLSAVDAHTAKHLYDNCLKGSLMKGRTIILVTHHVGLCIKGATYVVALEDGNVTGAGEPSELLASGVLSDELSHADEEKSDEAEEAALDGPVPSVPTSIKKDKKSGAGKLTQDEERAAGSVALAVYKAYFYASGGRVFWFSIIFLFCLAQGCVLGQDYWIKVWAAAYGPAQTPSNATETGIFSATRFGGMDIGAMTVQFLQPLSEPQEGNQEVDVTYYLGVYFLIGVAALIVSTLRSYILYQGSLSASRKIHDELLQRILRAKVRFFDTTPMGRIVNRFSSDLATIDQEIGPSLSFLLFATAATLCVVLLVSSITPLFLIPGTIITIAFWIIGSYYLETSRDMKRLNSVSRSPIYVQFNETVNGVSTIRAFGCQQRFINENFKKIDNNNRPFIWMWATNRWLHCRVDTLGAFVSFCTGFVLLLSRSWIDPGLAGLSLSYALTFTNHVLWVVRMYAVNEMNMNAIERVHEYFNVDEEPPRHIPETAPPANWPVSGSVKVENLVMQYSPENAPVLRDLSFEVKPMEKVGIVGRTGSGKSTLALSLFRFMEPTSGKILIDGVDIHKIGLEDLRSRLTIIPQDPVLFSGTLRSNLDPFDQHNDAELWAAIKRSHLIDAEQTEGTAVTLDAPVSENGSNWSQGQRQLIALARALVKKSSLIVLDEATSSVDFDTDHKIQETIRTEFVHSALLCIAHRIRTVADYDRILVLDHGSLVEYDTPYTLMTREGGAFQQMCIRSGEFTELLAIAKAKHDKDQL
ncbi:P-loop containing nucleoside triphosphate hydrolase protein [Spinellus fusiger]|nr:P-loop containing nucleoside triphosphate hydrolase protein [Spinellus fusiger]